jgi:hypothetical protein
MQIFIHWFQGIGHPHSILYFVLLIVVPFYMDAKTNISLEDNKTLTNHGVIRVIQPGVFDYQSKQYLIRMRAWGVKFPAREQRGYKEALQFTETKLLNQVISIVVKKDFDQDNIKVVDVLIGDDKVSFSRESIVGGLGWHIESETNRHGAFIISQIKAKRKNIGIWSYGNEYNQLQYNPKKLMPALKSMIGQNPLSASIQYWVTTFGKIHRSTCTFYERGRGQLSRRPTGENCRICGGTSPSK